MALQPSTVLTLAILLASATSPARSQLTDTPAPRSTPTAATSATVVPMLVRYDGTAASSDGKTVPASASMSFFIYKDEKGGEPLWIETQNVAVDAVGRYEVYLGATYSSGLPPGLFGTGEARWLEVQIAGETPGPRTLLTSVPYALKAADAATLGGLPPSAFVLASPVSGANPVGAQAITPDASASNVTTTGGTNFYVPRFNTATSIINSQIYDNGTSVGIGDVPNASARLDVNGAMIMRGNMQVTRTGNATTSKGYPSYGFQFYSNAYNSSTKANDNPYFQLQSEPAGNDTASPSATFNLLFANNGAAPVETGLSINPDGTINFASGQTFSGSSTTGSPGLYGSGSYGPGVSGTSQTGDGVYGSTGGSTNGTAGVYGKSGSASGQSGIAGVWGDSYSGLGILGTSYSGTGTKGVSSSSYGVEGTSTTGPGVLGYTVGNTLNTAGTIGQAGATSGFGGIAGVWGDASAHVGVFGSSNSYAGVSGSSTNGPGVQGASSASYGGQFTASSTYAAVYAVNNSSSGGVAVSSTAAGQDGIGVYANATGKGATAIEGIAAAGNDSNGVQPIGVYGYSTANGVLGSSTGGTLNTAGVLGVANGRTGYGGIAGVWGDAVGHIGVIGSSDQYPGVLGNSGTGDGVDGISTSRVAIYGIGGASSTSYSQEFNNQSIGVWGDTTGAGAGSLAVVGTATNAEAGFFTNNSGAPTIYAYNYGSGSGVDSAFKTFEASTPNGTCGIGGQGDLTCTGQVKMLATTNGGARTVETYAMQSPENWMEDFGTATLHGGVANVGIDAAFAETVSGSADYHVFLTPRGDSKGLYVTNLTASSFEVHESGGGTSTLDFDYRIVAKRRGFEAQRMVDVTEAMKTVNDRNAKRLSKAARADGAAQKNTGR